MKVRSTLKEPGPSHTSPSRSRFRTGNCATPTIASCAYKACTTNVAPAQRSEGHPAYRKCEGNKSRPTSASHLCNFVRRASRIAVTSRRPAVTARASPCAKHARANIAATCAASLGTASAWSQSSWATENAENALARGRSDFSTTSPARRRSALTEKECQRAMKSHNRTYDRFRHLRIPPRNPAHKIRPKSLSAAAAVPPQPTAHPIWQIVAPPSCREDLDPSPGHAELPQ